MATLKSIARSATVAFAPMSSMIAVGTMAGAIDPSFSSSASLEILQLDFTSVHQELPVIGSCPTLERFNRISWGSNVLGSEEFSLGIIAGGLVDGSINLWNPLQLLREEATEPEQALVARVQKHTGAVRGLEMSVLAPNLLASGGDEGDIYVWDLKVPSSPIQFPALRSGGATLGEITYLSWNRKVQPILASTSFSGTSVVWDLRKQKPVISFTDPSSRRRCSSLQWNPENATQLIVASDDDRSPSLQVWDLRNSVSPSKEFVGHSKGILAMAWCQSETSLLLTCAKDNLTLCWDTSTGEILYELPASNNWNFDVQWSPRIPGVLSTSSFDGQIGIYNIEACSCPAGSNFGSVLGDNNLSYHKKAPKWLKRPVGVSFGFGGKLITFGFSRKAPPGVVSTSTASEIHIHTLLTEDELVKASNEFEAAIANEEKPAMRAFCEAKAQLAGSKEEQETWSFLKVMFENDARRKLLGHLDFAVKSEDEANATEIEQTVDSQIEGPVISAESPELEVNPSLAVKESPLELGEAGEDFFDNLQAPRTPKEEVGVENLKDFTPESSVADSGIKHEQETNFDHENDSEEVVQRALVVGDFVAAVQHCLKTNRMADALILASVGGSALWEKTQNDYMRRSNRPYLKIVSAVVNNDLKGLVDKRPLKAWKETLALLCTYARSEDWTVLSDALAARLDSANDTQAATLCYICSGNIEKAAEIWSRSLETVHGGKDYVDVLQGLMEKAVVLSLATGQKRLGSSMAKLVGTYAELLVSQGLLTTAMEYLSLVSSEQSAHDLDVLRDRIYGSGQVSSTHPQQPATPWDSGPEPFPTFAEPVVANYSPTPASQQYIPQESFLQPNSYGGQYGAYGSSGTGQHYYEPNVPQAPGFSSMAAPVNQNVQTPVSTFYPANNMNTYAPVPQLAFPAPQQPTAYTPEQPPTVFTPVQPANTFTPVPVTRFTPVSQPSYTPVAQPPIPNLMIPTPPAAPVTAPPPSSPRFLQPSSYVQPVQPQSPQSTGASAVAPPAPPPTIQTVDTSNVSAELKPVVATLTRIFMETSEALGGARANPAKKREIENNSRKLGALFLKLNSADLSPNASSKLIQLCQALNAGDYATAFQIQVGLTTSDWDECSFWLAALKQMIKIRQNLR